MKKKNRSLVLVYGVKFSLFMLVLFSFLNARGEASELGPISHKSTNVTVKSSELQPFSINEETEPKNKRTVFYSDQNSSVDVNENGEPNLNMRF